MEFERICPTHNLPLKNFKGISKKTSLPYENWKCTYKDNGGYCEVIEWIDQVELTKKFTQTPNGVVESEAVWPSIGSGLEMLKPVPETLEPQNSDIRTILTRIEGKLDAIRKFQLGEHD